MSDNSQMIHSGAICTAPVCLNGKLVGASPVCQGFWKTVQPHSSHASGLLGLAMPSLWKAPAANM